MNLSDSVIQSSRKFKTPYLLVDLQLLDNKYSLLRDSLVDIEIFYAMKANDNKIICKRLLDQGAGFEVSSLNETKKLIEIGVMPEKIMCLNPIKSPEFLKYMFEKNIDIMAIDSYDEVDKIASCAPESKVLVRISVPETGSTFPLGNRYGVNPTEAVKMLSYAKNKGLIPYGITFHVGSQNPNYESWDEALKLVRKVYNGFKEEGGVPLELVSLGGGIPVEYTVPIPPIKEICENIVSAKKKNFPDEDGLKFSIEPGRGLVGDAGVMVATIVGRSERDGEQWLFLDCGVYNGLMEITGGFRFNFVSESANAKVKTTIAGPSCDSFDVVAEHIEFPNSKIGDKVYVLDVGCYSTVFASEFNGFEIPTTHFLNE